MYRAVSGKGDPDAETGVQSHVAAELAMLTMPLTPQFVIMLSPA